MAPNPQDLSKQSYKERQRKGDRERVWGQHHRVDRKGLKRQSNDAEGRIEMARADGQIHLRRLPFGRTDHGINGIKFMNWD